MKKEEDHVLDQGVREQRSRLEILDDTLVNYERLCLANPPEVLKEAFETPASSSEAPASSSFFFETHAGKVPSPRQGGKTENRKPSLLETLKRVIVFCFQKATKQGEDLQKMTGNIGFLDLWGDSLLSPPTEAFHYQKRYVLDATEFTLEDARNFVKKAKDALHTATLLESQLTEDEKKGTDMVFSCVSPLYLSFCQHRSWVEAHFVAQDGPLSISKEKLHTLDEAFVILLGKTSHPKGSARKGQLRRSLFPLLASLHLQCTSFSETFGPPATVGQRAVAQLMGAHKRDRVRRFRSGISALSGAFALLNFIDQTLNQTTEEKAAERESPLSDIE